MQLKNVILQIKGFFRRTKEIDVRAVKLFSKNIKLITKIITLKLQKVNQKAVKKGLKIKLRDLKISDLIKRPANQSTKQIQIKKKLKFIILKLIACSIL